MKFLSSLMVAITAVAGAMAQDTNATAFANGLLSALRANNLTALADAVGNNSEALLPALLTPGNKTVLAPSNAALQALGEVPTDALIATITYHVLNSTVDVAQINSGAKVIAASLLSNESYVDLGTGRSQVLVFSKFSGNNTAYVQQAGRNVSFALAANGPNYESIRVQPIENVLSIPGNTSTVAGQLGASQLATLLQNAQLVSALDSSTVTVFAPTNQAIAAVSSTIGAASAQDQTNVLLNHVVNGTTVYSTQLAGDNAVKSATSASGNELTFTANSTGAYVTSGSVTARIIQSDYAASNGVIHVIDAVLLNTTSNPQAAGSAYSSAASAAASPTGSTVPGVSGGTGGSTGSGSGSGGENGGMALKAGGATAVLSLLASAFWLIA